MQDHPDFKIEALAASERSAGKRFGEAVEWVLETEVKPEVKEIEVCPATVEGVESSAKVDVVFSALPASVAAQVEPEFAQSFPVFTNAGAFRRASDVAILIPEINPGHLEILKKQRRERGWKGFIVTNANCTTTGLVLSLKPIMDEFGIEEVRMVSMQAVSGAGFRGSGAISAMQIIDNVIPYIGGEEEKVQYEAKKILGELRDGAFKPARFRLDVSCNRVPVLDCHTECVFVETKEESDPERAKEVISNFRGQPQKLNLHSAPERPIWLMEEENRPQPRFDRMLERGMAIAVGRVRSGAARKSLVYVSCVHNNIRGSAGGSVLNAELARAMGYL